MESCKLLLKCPISNCKWQYASEFGGEQSFLLIQMHVDKEHVAQQIPVLETVKKLKSNPANIYDEAVNIRHNSRTSLHSKSKSPQTSPFVECPRCKTPFRRFNGRNRKPFKCCKQCYCRSTKNCNNSTSKVCSTTDDENTQGSSLGSIAAVNHSDHCNLHLDISAQEPLPKISVRDQPRITLRLCPVDTSTVTTVVGIADTGAQSNIWGLTAYLKAGYSRKSLRKVSLNLYAANKQLVPVIGGFIVKFEGDTPNGEIISCESVVYVSDVINELFVSLDTLICLGVVGSDFPTIGDIGTVSQSFSIDHMIGAIQSACPPRELNSGCSESPCNCPQRSAVPLRPKALPFEPTPDNNSMMKEWLLKYFESSTFNTCPHAPLQVMNGPPLEVHLQPDAVPRVCMTPLPIPLHWQQRVKQDIKRDVALGILEEVPYGVPVTWCHRMVVTRKHDGTPRRTVDLSPLNRYCKRELHCAQSPFHLARRVPAHVWKTTTDAWNGYHSVPLRKSDRHLTTFITPFGRYRYNRAPQGFLSSGDGYNRRFEAILEGFDRKERCIDDTIFYDDDLEAHWWRVIDFLIRVGQAGVVLNPDKFQFCSKEVDFAGFRISEATVEPLPKYINAVLLFPTPRNITDIRSWFGLVNQLSSYGQLRDMMAPFRQLLSSKSKFHWDSTLDQAFTKSKHAIVDAIKHGVEIFNVSKPTCLRTDWSCRGIGYFLLQKHCECSGKVLGCCSNGWKVTLAGSRFLSGAESRYPAIAGEALAIAWSLEQTRYFTQGCDDLLVVTDHRPLVKVLSDRSLDEITNTQLFRYKERTTPWRFRITYSPGKTNQAADATSRNPWSNASICQMSIGDLSDHITIAAIHREVADVTTVSWERVASETKHDPVLCELVKAINEGFLGTYEGLDQFSRYKHSLFIQEGVVMYQDRVVIPESLRQVVLDTLHAAHQGASSMQMRAQAIVFWPGISQDIAEKRNKCTDCNRNAPSQATLPSEPSIPPTSPFEQIFADFFDFGGHHYLVAGDRLSGFTEVFHTPTGSANAGSRGLIKCLRKWFATFGVPKQVSSDGGPEFSSESTSTFFKSWGVMHRVSSAYHAKSNGRAEVAVKTVKRLMRSNVGPCGTLDTDKFLRAMLQLRNTPDPDCGVSPAEIVFGRPLRDNLLFSDYIDRSRYSKRWQQAWEAKEDALRSRFVRTSEKINKHAKNLPPLSTGDKCFIQNQTGNHAKKWFYTGTIVEVLPHNKYGVLVDGSGRITFRNRQFLRKYTPPSLTVGSENLPPIHDPVVPPPLLSNTPHKSDEDLLLRRSSTYDIYDNVPIDNGSAAPVTNTSTNQTQPQQCIPIQPSVHENDQEHGHSNIKKPPLALRRLQDYNVPGRNSDRPPDPVQHSSGPRRSSRQQRKNQP